MRSNDPSFSIHCTQEQPPKTPKFPIFGSFTDAEVPEIQGGNRVLRYRTRSKKRHPLSEILRIFWVSIASFSLKNGVLPRESPIPRKMALSSSHTLALQGLTATNDRVFAAPSETQEIPKTPVLPGFRDFFPVGLTPRPRVVSYSRRR